MKLVELLKLHVQGSQNTPATPDIETWRVQDEEGGEASGSPPASQNGDEISRACPGSSADLMLFPAPTTCMPSSNMFNTPSSGPDPFCPVLCADLVVSVVSAAAQQGAGSGSQLLAAEATAAGTKTSLWDISHHAAGTSKVDGGPQMFAELVFDS